MGVKYLSKMLTVTNRESKSDEKETSQISLLNTYIKYDMFAVITLEPPISRPQLILPLHKCSSGNLYED